MKDPIDNAGRANPQVSRRSILYGLAAAAAIPIALEAMKAEALPARMKRPSMGAKKGKIKALPRHQHTATTLRNGAVMIAGGMYHGPLADARIYTADGWSAAARMNKARSRHSATLLADGRVLVLGGFNGSALNAVEIYDPSSDTWTVARPLATPRCDHAAALLPNGSVLITGGFNHGPLAESEIYIV